MFCGPVIFSFLITVKYCGLVKQIILPIRDSESYTFLPLLKKKSQKVYLENYTFFQSAIIILLTYNAILRTFSLSQKQNHLIVLK